MQKPRGIYTSEFWAGAVGSAAIALVALENGYRSEGAGLFGIALIVSTYIGGRCLIKAAQELAGRRLRLEPEQRQRPKAPISDDEIEDRIDAVLGR